MESFNRLGSMIINDARRTREIKSRIAMTKAAFSSRLDFNIRKKLVKCYIWSTASYGAETCTLRNVDQKYMESFEAWCWRRIGSIV